MHRRRFLQLGVVASATATAGCPGTGERGDPAPTPLVDPPTGVYHPTHVREVATVGTATAHGRTVALTYTAPRRYWTVSEGASEPVAVAADDDIYLVLAVWDAETGVALPIGSGVRYRLTRGDESLDERAPPLQLSQYLGPHYGENVQLSGEGTYAAFVHLPARSVRRRGSFAGRFGQATTVHLEFEYSPDRVAALERRRFPDRAGQRDAVTPRDGTDRSWGRAPAASALPGRHLGTVEARDAALVVTAAEADNGPYLAVSARTPINRFVLPTMAVVATVTREGSRVFEGHLEPAVGPRRRYHYGDTVPALRSGDDLTLAVESPTRLARHEGYETAFLEFEPTSVTIP